MKTSRSIAALALALAPALALAQPASSGPARTWNFEGTLWESLDLAKSTPSHSTSGPAEGDTVSGAAERSNPTTASDVASDAAQNGSVGGLGGGGGMPKTTLPSNGTSAAKGPGTAAGSALANTNWSAPAPGDVRAVAPVPEPQTYVLMLAGLGALGIVLRRRRGTRRQVLPD